MMRSNKQVLAMRLKRLGQGRLLRSLFTTPFLTVLLTGLPLALPLPLQSSSALAQTQTDRKAEADRLFKQAVQQLRVSQFREALQSWEQALQIYREIGDRQGEASALGSLGNAYLSLGQYQQAIDFSKQALVILREIGDRWGEASALGNLGIAYSNLGQYQQTIDFYEQQLAVAREIGNRQGEANALGNLGIAYLSLGQYPQAIDFSEQSLAIAREIGDRAAEGDVLGNLGNSYLSLGQYPQAIDFYERSLAIAREIGNRPGEASALGNLGVVYDRLGQYSKAIGFYEQYLAIAQGVGDRQAEVNVLANLGGVYDSSGQYQQAIEFSEQALTLAREIGDRAAEGSVLGNLGDSYLSLGQYQQAIDFSEQSLAIAQEIGNRASEGVALGTLGIAYLGLGQHPEALTVFEQNLAIAQEIGDRSAEGNALSNLGLALLNSNQFVAATEHLEAAATVLDSLRNEELGDAEKISLFETQTRTYNLLQKALIAQNEIERALAASEWGRARAFVSLLSGSLASASEPQAANAASDRISITQIQQIAKEQNATLVQYSVIGSEGLYIWVVQPTGEIAFRQVPFDPEDAEQAELVGSVVFGSDGLMRGESQDTVTPQLSADTRAALGVGRYATIGVEATAAITSTDRLRQLYQLLIEPIADLLPGNETDRVIFMPQGGLFFVPFAALIDANGDYLIEHHTISTAPSIEVLGLTRQLRHQNGQTTAEVLVVGNPIMPQLPTIPGQQPIVLPPLLGAEQEAQDIAAFFNTQALIGAQATETAVVQQMPQARIIHLATHGLLEYGNPEDSGVRDLPGAIALTPADGQDGLLTSAEILNLDLQAELVVLSACDTGRGRVTGDGVIGLSRSFISAGVPSVMVSLWSVPDAPTATLMTEFYQQWQHQPDKAQALRQAMLATMQHHPNPRDWAAFTLMGEAIGGEE